MAQPKNINVAILSVLESIDNKLDVQSKNTTDLNTNLKGMVSKSVIGSSEYKEFSKFIGEVSEGISSLIETIKKIDNRSSKKLLGLFEVLGTSMSLIKGIDEDQQRAIGQLDTIIKVGDGIYNFTDKILQASMILPFAERGAKLFVETFNIILEKLVGINEEQETSAKSLTHIITISDGIHKFALNLIKSTLLLPIAQSGIKLFTTSINLLLASIVGIDKERENSINGIKTLMDIGSGVLLFSLAMIVFIPTAPIVMLGVLTFSYTINILLKTIEGINTEKKNMLDGLSAILNIGKGVLLFSLTMMLYIPFAPLVIIGVGLFNITLRILKISLDLIDNKLKDKLIILSIIGLSIIALGLTLVLFDGLVSPKIIAKVVLSLISLGGVFALFGIAERLIKRGAMSMILASGSILILSLGLMMFKSIEFGLTDILILSGTLIGLGALMALAGSVAPLILSGAAVMAISGLALIPISLGIRSLLKIDFKALGNLNEIGNGPFNWSGEVSSGILGFGKGRKKSNLEMVLEGIAASLTLTPLSILGILTGAPVMILASTALILISKGINSFQKIAKNIDLPSLKYNVELITSALADTFAEIGIKYPGGGPSLLSMLTGNQKGKSVVAMGISAVSGMGRALRSIALGVQSMASLKFPTGYDKEGNPIGYETLDITTAVPALISNTKLLVSGLSSVFEEIGSSESAQGSTWFRSSTYEKGVKVVKKMGVPLSNLANGVQAMANLKFPTGYDADGNPTGYKAIGDVKTLVKNLKTNTKALILGLTSVFDDVTEGGNSSRNIERNKVMFTLIGSTYEKIGNSIPEIAKGMKSISVSTVKLKEQINGLDLDRLKILNSLMTSLAKLGSSNIGLDRLGEELGEGMKEGFELLAQYLSELLEQGKVPKTTTPTTQPMAQKPNTPEKIKETKTIQNPGLTGPELIRALQSVILTVQPSRRAEGTF